MIVPTTILSLAALSAAESNSSGKRGLRKSSTPWTAIAVVSGTAVVGLGAGVGLGYLWGSSGAAPGAAPGAGHCAVVNACEVDKLLIKASFCQACNKAGKYPKAGKGGKLYTALDGTTEKPFETQADCVVDGCRENWHQKTTLNVCVECPAGQYKDAKNTKASALETTCTGCKPNFYEITEGACEACPSTIPTRSGTKDFSSSFTAAADTTAAKILAHAVTAGCKA